MNPALLMLAGADLSQLADDAVVHTIAKRFSELLLEELGPAKMKKVVARNLMASARAALAKARGQ